MAVNKENIQYRNQKSHHNIYGRKTSVSLSVKTQLKSFFCDLLFYTKENILHMVKNILWKFTVIALILTE